MNDTPTTLAHNLAQVAEEYFEQGNYEKAIECHYRAAGTEFGPIVAFPEYSFRPFDLEEFLRAVQSTADARAVQTLKLMCQQQSRAAKDLEKRLNQLSIKQANNERLLPSFASSSSIPHQPTSLAADSPSLQPKSIHEQSDILRTGGQAIHFYSSPQRPYSTLTPTMNAGTANPGMGSHQFFMGQQGDLEDALNELPDINARRGRIMDGGGPAVVDVHPSESQYQISDRSTVRLPEQSYLVLDGNAKVLDEGSELDKDDPFTRFWDTVEGLVQRFPTAVAFTTAPLAEDTHQQESAPQTTINSTPMSRASASRSTPSSRIGLGQANRSHMLQHSMGESYMIVPSRLDASTIGAHNTTSRYSKTLEEYHFENEQLKLAVDQLTRKVMELEKAGRENDLLKSSIIRFRHDVQRQGKRYGPSNLSFSAVGPTPTTSSLIQQYESRIAELENQLRQQSVLLQKYQDKWAKLKETAKKRNQMQSLDTTTIVLRTDNDDTDIITPTETKKEAFKPATELPKESIAISQTANPANSQLRLDSPSSQQLLSTAALSSPSKAENSSIPNPPRVSLLSSSFAAAKMNMKDSIQPSSPMTTNSMYFSVYGSGDQAERTSVSPEGHRESDT